MGQTGVVKQYNLSFSLISHLECIKRYWETICKSLYRWSDLPRDPHIPGLVFTKNLILSLKLKLILSLKLKLNHT